MQPLVSLVIPTIGRPDYLSLTLACVAQQTYPHLDILVSDNAANPPLEQSSLAAAFRGRAFRLVRRESRLPFSEHFNQCLAELRGEYAMFLSDDDLIAPKYLESAVKAMQGQDVRLVLSRQTRIDPDCMRLPEWGPEVESTPKVMPMEDYLRDWLCRQNAHGVLTTVSMFGPRKRLLAAGGFANYPGGAHADNILMIRTGLGGKIAILSGGFCYRIWPSSVGLGMSWPELCAGCAQYESHLDTLVKEGKLPIEFLKAFVRLNSMMQFVRWKTLYWRRSGLQNKIAPIFSLLYRLVVTTLRYGLSATPLGRAVTLPFRLYTCA